MPTPLELLLDPYADLPVFDILFGSFHNPPDFVPDTGFYVGASRRVGEMLMFRDVATPRANIQAAVGADAEPVTLGNS